MSRILAIIPARGGSKGVPRKNVRPVNGQPLIAYTFQTVKQAKPITRCILSTDDTEIADLARVHGIDVPFMRPPELATDEASTLDVVLHAVAEVERAEEQAYDVVLLLQPTAPLRSVEDMVQALALLEHTGADSVISFYQIEHGHPYYMYTLDDGKPQPIMKIPTHVTRRQDFPAVYVRNGAIYATKRDVLVEQRTFYGAHTQAYVMPYERSINIDSEFDLAIAELLLRKPSGNP